MNKKYIFKLSKNLGLLAILFAVIPVLSCQKNDINSILLQLDSYFNNIEELMPSNNNLDQNIIKLINNEKNKTTIVNLFIKKVRREWELNREYYLFDNVYNSEISLDNLLLLYYLDDLCQLSHQIEFYKKKYNEAIFKRSRINKLISDETDLSNIYLELEIDRRNSFNNLNEKEKLFLDKLENVYLLFKKVYPV